MESLSLPFKTSHAEGVVLNGKEEIPKGNCVSLWAAFFGTFFAERKKSTRGVPPLALCENVVQWNVIFAEHPAAQWQNSFPLCGIAPGGTPQLVSPAAYRGKPL